MSRHYLVAIVENNAGVLARISSLCCQRAFNIDSLTVSTTGSPNVSRITIVTSGDDDAFEQLKSQTAKLPEVIDVFPADPDETVIRELLLLKFEVTDENRFQITSIAESNHARIINNQDSTLVIEMTADPTTIDLFIELMMPFRLIEMCRTGATAIAKGATTFHSES
ncbi:MAG: acetolactate synthase small subunit [Clostridia bacterium]|nr:acetolactate synthase small subunit [Clostridia bacterium]MBQ3928152.1 acetolactate synthase small subunit [Clostridia bacterium]